MKDSFLFWDLTRFLEPFLHPYSSTSSDGHMNHFVQFLKVKLDASSEAHFFKDSGASAFSGNNHNPTLRVAQNFMRPGSNAITNLNIILIMRHNQSLLSHLLWQ